METKAVMSAFAGLGSLAAAAFASAKVKDGILSNNSKSIKIDRQAIASLHSVPADLTKS